MNTPPEESPRSRSRAPYSALAILVFSSAVVLISVYILFNYVTGVFQRQTGLEDQLQAILTEESAAELLAADLSSGSIADFAMIPSYSIDRQQTSFQLAGINSTPPEDLFWGLECDQLLDAVPLRGSNCFAVVYTDGDTLIVDALSVSASADIRRILDLVDHDLDMGSAAVSSSEDGIHLLIPDNDRSGGKFVIIPPGGAAETLDLDISGIHGEITLFTFVSEGVEYDYLAGDGPHGILIDTESGNVVEMAGSSTIRAEGDSNEFLSAASIVSGRGQYLTPVRDILKEDFTGDGATDVLLARPGNASFVDGASGLVYNDSVPGFDLVAWGTTESRGLLSCRWVSGEKAVRWRTFLNGEFRDAPGPEFLPYDWNGRMFYSRNSMLGTISDTVFVAFESGSLLPLFPSGSSVFCEVDGRGMDIVHHDGTRLGVLLNPLEGNGLHLTMRAVTSDEDRNVLLHNSWSFLIYGSGPGKRVRWERSG